MIRAALCLALFAAPALAAAAPTAITTCGTTISAPGSYALAQDVGPCPGVGIAIAASDVTLTLAGRALTGSASAAACNTAQPQIGIAVLPGALNVVVRAGDVSRFTTGVQIDGETTTVRALRIADNCDSGVVANGIAPLLERLEVTGSRVGVRLCSPESAQLNASTIAGNAELGVDVGCAGGTQFSLISQNVLRDNGFGVPAGAAIRVTRAQDTQLSDNAALGNANGIVLVDGDRLAISRNDASGNADLGIALPAGALDNLIDFNSALGNRVDLSEENACDLNLFSQNEFAVGVGCVQ
jgi:parallel beta-helix repeat protein